MHQLDIFYAASFKVSKRDKETRMFYLERTVNEVMSESRSVDDSWWLFDHAVQTATETSRQRCSRSSPEALQIPLRPYHVAEYAARCAGQ